MKLAYLLVLITTTIFSRANAEQALDCRPSMVQDGIFTYPTRVELTKARTWTFRADGIIESHAVFTPLRNGIQVVYSKTEQDKSYSYTYSFNTSKCDNNSESSGVLIQKSFEHSDFEKIVTLYSCTCEED